jgi:hypothetical protein
VLAREFIALFDKEEEELEKTEIIRASWTVKQKRGPVAAM